MDAAIDFIEKTIIIAEVVRLLPPFLAPYVKPCSQAKCY
jgi:hypothetical protein